MERRFGRGRHLRRAGRGGPRCPPRRWHEPTAVVEPKKKITPAAVPSAGNAQTQVEMVNVDIHLDPDLVLHIHHLSGQFVPTRKGQPPAFDDKLSYIVAIDSAEIGVSMASMSHAMNTYVFGASDAPLKDLKLSAHGSEIRQTGTLKKGVGIPFEMTGTMSATPDGKIRIHPAQVKAAHLPVQGVMKLFGLDMAKVINTRKTKGLIVDGNDVILDPAQMLPPPMSRPYHLCSDRGRPDPADVRNSAKTSVRESVRWQLHGISRGCAAVWEAHDE